MSEDINPLVSILIPTYNRQRYFEAALKSAAEQTYSNLEIIVCDDSTNDETEKLIEKYLKNYPCIKYFRNAPPNDALKNFDKCLSLSTGKYINYLMDDDAFSADKIKTMVKCFEENENISLVTSYRQLIDSQDNILAPIPATKRLRESVSVLEGSSLSNYILLNMLNVVGEPTTAMFRRKDMDVRFGEYCGKRYYFNIDVAAWLHLLSKGNAIYLPQPLSTFRLHGGQNQNTEDSDLSGHLEWFNLIKDSYDSGRIPENTYDDCLHNWLKKSLYIIKGSRRKTNENGKISSLYDCLDYTVKRLFKQ